MSPLKPGEFSQAGVRQQQEKLFYVSPFVEMAMRYHFRVSPPGGQGQIADPGDRPRRPAAVGDLHRPPPRLTTPALLPAFFALPFVTLKIVAAIHWEALRLWLKGARLVPRPNAAATNGAFDETLATPERNDYTRPRLPAVGHKPGLREGALVQ